MILYITAIKPDSVIVDPQELIREHEQPTDVLVPNLGAHFKYIGKLQASKDQLYMDIVVQLPDIPTLIMILSDNRFQQLYNKCPKKFPITVHEGLNVEVPITGRRDGK